MRDGKYGDIFEAGVMFRTLLVEKYYDSYKGDLTYQQCRVFDSVCDNPGISENDLVHKYGLSKQHIHLIVSKLVDNGLVYKEENPEDKRSYKILPTDQGTTYYAEHLAMADRNYDDLLKKLSPEDAVEFEDHIRSINQMFKKMINN